MNQKELGNLGEKYAEKFLSSQNYKILKTNFHCKYGEIDIIVVENPNEKFPNQQLVFIEF